MKATLIDSMGDDLTVVNSARVSFRKQSNQLDERDIKLIQYLAKHKHWTPFAHVMFQFRISAPLFVARQWYRHTVGFARNEVSRRYVDDQPAFYEPKWRERALHKKQGSAGSVSDIAQQRFSKEYWALVQHSQKLYTDLLNNGVAPEQARMVLPQSMYTEWVETASLYAYVRLVEERVSDLAQQEIKELAVQIQQGITAVCPHSVCAYLEQ